MIPGLFWLSDEMAMAITCMLCLGTGMMLGMMIMLLRDKEED